MREAWRGRSCLVTPTSEGQAWVGTKRVNSIAVRNKGMAPAGPPSITHKLDNLGQSQHLLLFISSL